LPDQGIKYFQGAVLSLLGIAATVGLALTGKLDLYIHPRYVVFTVLMSILAAVLAVASFGLQMGQASHDHPKPSRARTQVVLLLTLSVLVVLIVPASALSEATAQRREVNQTFGSASSSSMASPDGADFAHFRMRDWAAAIQLAATPRVLSGRPFDEVGFVMPDGDRPDLFFVSRFVVTCCAVDAQPVGVPVLRPEWRGTFAKGTWVRVRGALGIDPHDPDRSVVVRAAVDAIHEPGDPYEY
jgi:putative membrane protein